MAQLKDTLIQGSARVTDTLYTNKILISQVLAPTASNGTTFGPGTNGYILKSNGTSVYWSSDISGDWTGTTIPVNKGGTGATTAANAIKNLVGSSAIGGTAKPIYYKGDGTFSAIGTGSKIGDTNKSIYVATDGTLTAGSTYAGGTAVTLNNASKAASTASFYAPTAGGTADTQALVGNGATAAPKWVNISPSISITAGTSSAAPKVNVTVLGQSGTAQSITTATTGLYGVTKLSSTSSTSEEGLAATPKGVWAAIDTVKYQTGSTNTSDKIFLIGAKSQAGNVSTYSDDQVYVTNGTLYLVKTQDLSGTANSKPALIIGGADTSSHMELDANEIQAKANGTTTADLHINNDGGLVNIGPGGLTSKGNFTVNDGKTATLGGATTIKGTTTLQNNLRRYYSAASTDPMITAISNNQDMTVLNIGHGTAAASSTASNYYKLKYVGTGNTPNNYLQLLAGAAAASETVAVQVDENGNITFKNVNLTGTLEVTGQTTLNDNLIAQGITATDLVVNGPSSFIGDINATNINIGTNLDIGDNLNVNGSSVLGAATAGSNTTTTINGHLVINPSYNTSNSYNEGIRINLDSNGWANVQFGGTIGNVSGVIDGQWLVGRRGQAASSNGMGAVGDFSIEEGNSIGHGLTIHKDESGMSLYASKAASNDIFTIKNMGIIAASGWSCGIRYLTPNMANTSHVTFSFGKAKSTKNSGNIEYYHHADASNDSYVGLGHYNAEGLLRVYTNGRVTAKTDLSQDLGTNAVAWANVHTGNLYLKGSSTTNDGRIYWWKPTNYVWTEYLATSADGKSTTGGKPAALGEVSSYAFRSLANSGDAGYGWIWEAAPNSAAAATTTLTIPRMALSAYTGRLRIEPNATTSTNKTSGLIISSEMNGSSGTVGLELWRGTNASWQIVNDTGTLHFKNNYTTAVQTTYSVDSVTIAYNTGIMTLNGTTASSSTSTGVLVVKGGLGVAGQATINNVKITATTASSSTSTGALIVAGGAGIAGQATINNVKITADTASSSTSTGALIVAGGTGIAGKLYVGNNFYQTGDSFQTNANNIVFRNKSINNNQAGSYPYITGLTIGDNSEITLDEYKDGYLCIHSKSGLLIYPTGTARIAVYDATKTYAVGDLVWYSRQYYRCKTAIDTAEAWTSSKWTALPTAAGAMWLHGNINPTVTNIYTLGTSTYRWKSLEIGTASSYGSSTQPIYWDAGVPKAIDSVGIGYGGTGATNATDARSNLGLGSFATRNSLAWNEITQSGANNLDSGASDFTDGTQLLTSYASNNGFNDANGLGKVYKRNALTMYNYITDKIRANGLRANLKGGYLENSSHYDGTSNYASYAWHKIASVTLTGSYWDAWIKLLVTNGEGTNNYGILYARIRTGGNSAYEQGTLTWEYAGTSINVNNFVLVYSGNAGNVKGDLWAKIDGQYHGYFFTVLDRGNRGNGGQTWDGTSTQAGYWHLQPSLNGHGSANYTSGTGTIVSSFGSSQLGGLRIRALTANSSALNSANPLIEFSNYDRAQYCQLVYTDYDSQQDPDALWLVGNQPNTTLVIPRLRINRSGDGFGWGASAPSNTGAKTGMVYFKV